jgi:hypothetical protein
MAANIDPIYCKSPDIQWDATVLTAANTAKDGTGTVDTIWTADASNGGYLNKIVIRAAGTNIATVMRVFINNGLTNATPANNSLYTEITLAATTLSEVAALTEYVIPMNIPMPAGYKINVTLGTAVAAGFYTTGVGGKY